MGTSSLFFHTHLYLCVNIYCLNKQSRLSCHVSVYLYMYICERFVSYCQLRINPCLFTNYIHMFIQSFEIYVRKPVNQTTIYLFNIYIFSLKQLKYFY